MENQVGRLRTENDQPFFQTVLWCRSFLPALAQDGMRSPFKEGCWLQEGEAALEHLHFPYALPAKCYTPPSCWSAHTVLIRALGCQSMCTQLRALQPNLPSCLLAAWPCTLGAPHRQSGGGRCSTVLRSPHILPLHLQLACHKPRLSECRAIASRGELGLFMTNRCCLADVGTIWELLKK